MYVHEILLFCLSIPTCPKSEGGPTQCTCSLVMQVTCTCTCILCINAHVHVQCILMQFGKFSVLKNIQQLLFKILLWPFMAMKMTKSILLLFLSHFPNYMSVTCTLHIYVHFQSLFSCDNYITVWKIFRQYQNNYTCIIYVYSLCLFLQKR